MEITNFKENTGIVIHIDSFSNLKDSFRISNGRTQRCTSQTLARVDPKKTGSCPSGGVRGTHISQPQPVEPPRFESKYLAARILALGNSPHVPGP